MPIVGARVIRGRKKFANYPQVRKVLGAALDNEVKPHFVQRFEMVVANWKHKPGFQARKYITADAIRLAVYPTGPNAQIWECVSFGTRPHKIRVRRAKTLAFLWGGPGSYKPKTSPPGKFGGPGSVSGGVMHFPVAVNHPGNEPREFEKTIADDERDWYNRTEENAWRRAIRSL